MCVLCEGCRCLNFSFCAPKFSTAEFRVASLIQIISATLVCTFVYNIMSLSDVYQSSLENLDTVYTFCTVWLTHNNNNNCVIIQGQARKLKVNPNRVG